jgi:cell division protein FtsW (lipid II flippase)
MLMVLAQPDLGTAMVFGGVLLATMFWAGTPLGIMFLLPVTRCSAWPSRMSRRGSTAST